MGYRIVGLSATPGNRPEKIQEVLTNLHAFRLESKDDNDPDVKKYVHTK
jgi:ERCC4-related helicase